MRLAHGSGLEGLRGMDYFSRGRGRAASSGRCSASTRQTLRAIVDEAGLDAGRRSVSNADTDYERVRWRQVLPQLAALGLDARAAGAVRLARMRDADRALGAMAERAYAEVAVDGADGGASIEPRLARGAAARRRRPRRCSACSMPSAGGRKPHALGAGRALDRPAAARSRSATTLHGCIVRSDGDDDPDRREPLSGARAQRARQRRNVTPH